MSKYAKLQIGVHFFAVTERDDARVLLVFFFAILDSTTQTRSAVLRLGSDGTPQRIRWLLKRTDKNPGSVNGILENYNRD